MYEGGMNLGAGADPETAMTSARGIHWLDIDSAVTPALGPVALWLID